jgi:hypothetical protein
MIIAVQFGTHLAEPFYKRLCQQNNKQGRPEFHLHLLCIGAYIVSLGFIWYGYSARESINRVIP